MYKSPLLVHFFPFLAEPPSCSCEHILTHTGFYYADLTLLKLGGETAVLVWPWAHPSLVPASLHSSSSIPPLFQISPSLSPFPSSLPLSYIVSRTTPHPFIIFTDLISASLPSCPSIFNKTHRTLAKTPSPPRRLPSRRQKQAALCRFEKKKKKKG